VISVCYIMKWNCVKKREMKVTFPQKLL